MTKFKSIEEPTNNNRTRTVRKADTQKIWNTKCQDIILAEVNVQKHWGLLIT